MRNIVKHSNNFARRNMPHNNQGVALIEVLVGFLLLTVTLVGSIGLSIASLKAIHTADVRQKAVVLVNDLAERIEINSQSAKSGGYAVTSLATAKSLTQRCYSVACTPSQLAEADMAEWATLVDSQLRSASATVVADTTGGSTSYVITINWIDRGWGNSNDQTEAFSYTASRMMRP